MVVAKIAQGPFNEGSFVGNHPGDRLPRRGQNFLQVGHQRGTTPVFILSSAGAIGHGDHADASRFRNVLIHPKSPAQWRLKPLSPTFL